MRLSLLLLACGCASGQTYDVIITGGRVVDGTGNAWFYGDVAIRGDRIARIAPRGMLAGAPARERIDARGLVVSPGFIDIQGQSRGQLLNGDGRLISHLTQGITTEIMGEGVTDAPANDKTLANESEEARRLDSRFTGPHGFRDWLEAMQQHGSSLNFGSFAGATTLRMYGKGMAQGAPTEAELEEMRGALKRAMEDGAFGMASALIYPPGEYTTTRELVELAKVMAPYGGVYITHMRSESDHLLEAIDEAIEIGREGGVPVEIYHLKASGEANWPKMKQAIAKIDEARRAGIDISADMYPYVAGGTGLTACLPPWSAADGKLFENLNDPATRKKIHDEAMAAPRDWENICREATPSGVMILRLASPQYRQYQGERLSEIAAALHKDWADTAIDLISAEHSRIETMFFIGSEENVKLQLQQPWIKISTDAGGVDPAWAEERGPTHPRAYGTYPRVLGKYVREEKVITLEDAVRKMTSSVADRVGLRDRGLLRAGHCADIVIFDPETIGDRSTFEAPHQLSVGVRDVWVNGVRVLRDSEHTGATPGQVVRGPGAQTHT